MRNFALASLACVAFIAAIAVTINMQNKIIQSEARLAIEGKLEKIEERLRIWKLFGMYEVLNRELSSLKIDLALADISIISVNDLGKLKKTSQLISIPKNVDNNVPFVLVAHMSDGSYGKITIPLSTYGVLLLGSILLLIVAVYKTNRFFDKEIRQPILGILNEFRSTSSPEQILDKKISGIISNSRVEVRELAEQFQTVITLRNEVARNKALAKLVAQVSHDIRSPIAALNVFIKLAEWSDPEHANISQMCLKRMREIMDDLVKRYDPSTGTISQTHDHTTKTKTSVAKIIEEIIKEKQMVNSDKKVLIKAEILPHTTAMISKLSSDILQRVLSNLINNSIEALSEETGSVNVRLSADVSDTLNIEIIDTGKGIPPEVLSKIGKHGFSYGKQKGESGHGLGLSYAMEQVKAANGEVSIDSKVGKGTKISLLIPAEQIA
ncbi:MAG: hypothetical protein HY072_07080 [Deltaproteobacteria bacterium]|nr:hypothetical protein [Deltaproteobacteria bacterium]